MHTINFVIKPIRSALFSLTLIFFTILFLIPQHYVSGEIFNWWDKAQHSLAFAIMTITGFFSHPKQAKIIAICLVSYGGLIEIFQSLSGWRDGELMDWAADSIGVVTCYGLRHFGLQYFTKYKDAN